MDWSLPGSSVHGIFQARVLEWVASAFSPGDGNPTEKVENWKRFQLGRREEANTPQQMKEVISGSDNAVKIMKQTDVNRQRLKIT